MYKVVYNDVAENELQVVRCCSYADFIAWRREGRVSKIITPGNDGTNIDDILQTCKILTKF